MSLFDVALNAGISVVSEVLTIRPYRALAGITADAVLEEVHSDELVVTDHPVEQGSTISDHAYKMPANLVLTYGWGSKASRAFDAGALTSIYNQLLQLQIDRTLFEIYTGKRYYSSMLLQSVGITTDVRTENGLIVRAACREIIQVQTQTVNVASNDTLASPQKNSSTLDVGRLQPLPSPTLNVG